MDYESRCYHIQRIIVGQTFFDFNDEPLWVGVPTPLIKLRAEHIYQKVFSNNTQLMSYQDSIIWMIECGLWDTDREQELENAYKDLDTLKVGYLESEFNINNRDSILIGIKTTEKRILELENERNAYYGTTKEGVASWMKTRYLLGSCIYNMDGKQYLNTNFWDNGDGNAVISTAMNAVSNDTLDEYGIRELSRLEPWISIWTNSKYTNSIFECSPSCLTSEQKGLIIWTQTYESLAQRDDVSKDIIEDNYALDGWMIKNAREKSENNKSKSITSRFGNKKVANSEHIFVMTGGNDENIAKINAANTKSAQMFKKQYMRDISSNNIIEDQKTSFGQNKLRSAAVDGYKQMANKVNKG